METKNWEVEIQEMRRIEETVLKSEGGGLRARWESGRYMLTLKKGKQLPKGVLAKLTVELGVKRSELTARRKFADKFSEAELPDVIGKFRTWFAITHEALTDRPHTPRGRTPPRKVLARGIQLIESVDPEALGEGDQELLAQLDEIVRRLKDGVRFPKAA